jgi:hypothetical protein
MGIEAGFQGRLYSVDVGWPHLMLTLPLGFVDRRGRLWEAPADFVSDLASVPWFARWLVPRAGRHNRAAVIHDWLFHLRELRQLEISRWEVDSIMNQAMKADKVRPTRRWLIRMALFAGSWVPWYFGKPNPLNLHLR